MAKLFAYSENPNLTRCLIWIYAVYHFLFGVSRLKWIMASFSKTVSIVCFTNERSNKPLHSESEQVLYCLHSPVWMCRLIRVFDDAHASCTCTCFTLARFIYLMKAKQCRKTCCLYLVYTKRANGVSTMSQLHRR